VWFLLLFNLAGKIAALAVGSAVPAVALALWFVPDAVLAYHVFTPHAQGLVRAPRRFHTERREVWLTIDDGPDPTDTPQILALLAAHDARATFFTIGRNVLAHPDLVRTIAAAGHEVAHHTHTHPLASFWCASPARVRRELDDACTALHTLGLTPARFRPPANLKNLWLAPLLASRGLACIGWTTRGLERWHTTPDAVANRALRRLAPGNILLLHEGPRVPSAIRVEAIRRVLARLHEQGYRCVIPAPAQLAGHSNS
jgi:peptidoglycan/xylan/chitin deacetylase (PgdA/CDA1 family)